MQAYTNVSHLSVDLKKSSKKASVSRQDANVSYCRLHLTTSPIWKEPRKFRVYCTFLQLCSTQLSSRPALWLAFGWVFAIGHNQFETLSIWECNPCACSVEPSCIQCGPGQDMLETKNRKKLSLLCPLAGVQRPLSGHCPKYNAGLLAALDFSGKATLVPLWEQIHSAPAVA